MENPFVFIVRKLGELPKGKRRTFLLILNIPIFVDFFLGLFHSSFKILPRETEIILCIIAMGIELTVLSYGGWWWANNEDENDDEDGGIVAEEDEDEEDYEEEPELNPIPARFGLQ